MVPPVGAPVDIVLPSTVNYQFINLQSDDVNLQINSITDQGGAIYTLQGPSAGAEQQLTLANNATLKVENSGILDICPDPAIQPPLTGSLPDSLKLNFLGATTVTGVGTVALNSLSSSHSSVGLETIDVSGVSLRLGTSSDFSGSLFQVDSNAELLVLDHAIPKIGSLTGGGRVQIGQRQGNTSDTGLTIATPAGESDSFTGAIQGEGGTGGTITMQGAGTLSVGSINQDNLGPFTVNVQSGWFKVTGDLNAASLAVSPGARFGGPTTASISQTITLSSGAIFGAELDGTEAGQYTTLTSTGSPINLGSSRLAVNLGQGYIPAVGSTFTILSAPAGITGSFVNVPTTDPVVLGNKSPNYPFEVIYGQNSVMLKAIPATSTHLQSSPNPSTQGTSVTLTATVSSGVNPVTAGTVTFYLFQGQSLVAQGNPVPVDSTGTATTSLTTLPAGTDTIVALYNGEVGTFGPSWGVGSETVSPVGQPTITSAATSHPPFYVGQPFLLAAKVTSGLQPVSAGTVTFVVNVGSMHLTAGIVPLRADGIAFMFPTLPAGSFTLDAVYNPPLGSGFLTSTSNVLPVTVNLWPTATSLRVTSQRVGRIVQWFLSAGVVGTASGSPAVSGVVAFERNGIVIGTASVVGGTAKFSLGRTRPRGFSFLAIFQANGGFASSTSNTVRT
jgi:hypothetical protein